jgi:hypothetical protein
VEIASFTEMHQDFTKQVTGNSSENPFKDIHIVKFIITVPFRLTIPCN